MLNFTQEHIVVIILLLCDDIILSQRRLWITFYLCSSCSESRGPRYLEGGGPSQLFPVYLCGVTTKPEEVKVAC